MTQVSLVKTDQSYQGTLKALEPLKADLIRRLKNLERVVIKINFVTVYKKLATTPLETVKGFIDFIKPFFKGKIIIAEEASVGSAKNGFRLYGFSRLAKKDPQIEVFDSGEDDIEIVKIKYSGGEMKLPLAKIYLQSPFIASICRAKTHDTVVATLAIKNLLVGAIQGGISQRSKIHQGKDIHRIMTEITQFTYPDLAIIDGVIGMEGNGPGSGNPIRADWILSSLDPLAADSLAAYLMGFKIEDIGYLNLMKEKNLGRLYPKDKIPVIGDNPEELKKSFRPHQTFEYQRQWQQSNL